MHCTLYAVKAQTSLAPLSWFHGSRVTTAHVHQCCRFQSYAKTVPSRMKLTMKLTMREPAFMGSMTTDTWSRRVTSDFNSVYDSPMTSLTNCGSYLKQYLHFLQTFVRFKMSHLLMQIHVLALASDLSCSECPYALWVELRRCSLYNYQSPTQSIIKVIENPTYNHKYINNQSMLSIQIVHTVRKHVLCLL